MNQEIVNQVLQIFNNLGKVISDSLRAIFEIYTKQSFSEGIANLVLGLILLVAFIILVKSMCRIDLSDCNDDETLAIGFGSIVGFIIIVISLVSLYTGVLKIANPQYYAIEKMIERVRK